MNISDEVVRDCELTKVDLQRKKQAQDKAQLNLLRSWLANQHFQGCRTASITIHLKRDKRHASFSTSSWKVEDQADRISIMFFRYLNKKLYGKGFRNHGKHVRFCASLHIEGGNPHLHVVAEIPEDRSDLELFKRITEEFCRQQSLWNEVAANPYVDETRFNKGALQYNNDNTKCRDFDDIDGPESLRLVR
jgi:hypothetical protein